MHTKMHTNLQSLDKRSLVSLCRSHGWRGDEARLSKGEFEQWAMANVPVPADAIPAAPIAPTFPDPRGAAEQLLGIVQSLAGASLNEERVREIARDEAKAIRSPERTIIIDRRGTEEKRIDVGVQHKQFTKLLAFLSAGLNVWITGPAGSGKTTACEAAAKALGIPFSFNGALDSAYKISGFVDAQGRIVSTQFRDRYTGGGLHLFDECDASFPSATLAMNAALANGYAEFPDGMQRKHESFVCCAAANTWGHGATSQFVGRNQQDKAFLDRFVRLNWDYDPDLERNLVGLDSWVSYVQAIRARVFSHGLQVIVSPRASINGAKLLRAGMPVHDVVAATISDGMSPEQWASVSRDISLPKV